MIKVGINGFGRIGRFVFRAAQTRNDIQIVGINDLCPVDYLAYMLKYDTMHGQFDGTIEANVEKSQLIVNGKTIRVTAEKNPADLKWNEVGAELCPLLPKTILLCSFAVLTKILTLKVLNSFPMLLVQPTAWLLSPKY